VFETEESSKPSPAGEEQAPLCHLMDHLDLNLPQIAGEIEDNSSLELQGSLLCLIFHIVHSSSQSDDTGIKIHNYCIFLFGVVPTDNSVIIIIQQTLQLGD
jgi:hypothetical protein